MPKPRPNEQKEDYISRCIPVVINEGKSREQAYAICQGMWEDRNMSAYEKIIKEYKTPKN
jgi:hypothetical protein